MYSELFGKMFKNFWRDTILVIVGLLVVAGLIGLGIGYLIFR